MTPALSALFLSLAIVRQDGTLLDPKVRDLLHEELSGEIAKEHVIAITRHHRIQGSRGYHDAAEWVLTKLREYGFDEKHAWIESFPSDGKIHYQTWQSPSGWDIESAELRMLEPRDWPGVGADHARLHRLWRPVSRSEQRHPVRHRIPGLVRVDYLELSLDCHKHVCDPCDVRRRADADPAGEPGVCDLCRLPVDCHEHQPSRPTAIERDLRRHGGGVPRRVLHV